MPAESDAGAAAAASAASRRLSAASPAEGSDWFDAPSRDALQLIAEGVTQLAGFGVGAISVARPDGKLQVMAVAGSDEARDELHDRRTPIDLLQAEIDKGDDWGLFVFVPHERLSGEAGDQWGWVPDIDPVDDAEDAWHPLDLLIAPVYDDTGALRGTLAIDLPLDGRRPGLEKRAVLNAYAEQAGRAVMVALEREEMADRVRMAEAARRIVRRASSHLTLDRIFEESREALLDGFRAAGMWLQTFDSEGQDTIHSADGQQVTLPPELIVIAEDAARRAWEEQTSLIVAPDREFSPAISAEQGELILEFLRSIDVGSLLFTPLGAGPECLGNLVLTRLTDGVDWTDAEAATALDIGHDLGRAILNARTFEREHQLVEELQELDQYKGQLIATVAHELKNPLTSVMGHLEMLEAAPDLTGTTRTSIAAMERGARRMVRVIEDLLLLSKVGDPANPVIAVPVDLRKVVDDVVDLTTVAADQKQLDVRVEVPSEPVVALGDAFELDRVCANLVSNAVKYTRPGGRVTISLERGEGSGADGGYEAVLTVADEGIGIADADLAKLGTEFFRSSNPEAVQQPGTGLGLAIVSRIVARHHGRLEISSELGVGSTFRVRLPVG
jgi:signal transduction histidine kinase